MPKKISHSRKTALKAGAAGFRKPQGMYDVLPAAEPWRQRIRKTIGELAVFYNFSRIETPAVESEELFAKAFGDGESDLSLARVYRVKAKGEKGFILRPEGTIP
ncbi:MAG: hypothetical protein AAB967_01600, partial [Patescibacteria group bacterium]